MGSDARVRRRRRGPARDGRARCRRRGAGGARRRHRADPRRARRARRGRARSRRPSTTSGATPRCACRPTWTTSRRATWRPRRCRCWSASARPAGRWRNATASSRTRRSPTTASRPTATTSRAAAVERAFRLDPLAEQAFAARGDAASTAWRRLYDDTMTAVTVPFDAGDGVEPHSLNDLRALLWHRDRDVRLRSVAAGTEARAAVAATAAACLDAVIGDRLVEDRLRGHDDPMGATLFTDQVTRADVESLLTAIEGRASIVRRWYERKAAALGIDECTERRPHGARRRPAGGALERGRDARPRRLRGPRRRARRAGPRADGERPDRRRAARRQVGGRLLRAAAAGLSVADPDDLPRHSRATPSRWRTSSGTRCTSSSRRPRTRGCRWSGA